MTLRIFVNLAPQGYTAEISVASPSVAARPTGLLRNSISEPRLLQPRFSDARIRFQPYRDKPGSGTGVSDTR